MAISSTLYNKLYNTTLFISVNLKRRKIIGKLIEISIQTRQPSGMFSFVGYGFRKYLHNRNQQGHWRNDAVHIH